MQVSWSSVNAVRQRMLRWAWGQEQELAHTGPWTQCSCVLEGKRQSPTPKVTIIFVWRLWFICQQISLWSSTPEGEILCKTWDISELISWAVWSFCCVPDIIRDIETRGRGLVWQSSHQNRCTAVTQACRVTAAREKHTYTVIWGSENIWTHYLIQNNELLKYF